MDADEDCVWVRRQWNSPFSACYRLSDLRGVRWDRVSGGVHAPTPQPFLHAFVSCQLAVDGELAHSGTHGPCPHSIKVCIVKKDNPAGIFSKLLRLAGPKPTR